MAEKTFWEADRHQFNFASKFKTSDSESSNIELKVSRGIIDDQTGERGIKREAVEKNPSGKYVYTGAVYDYFHNEESVVSSGKTINMDISEKIPIPLSPSSLLTEENYSDLISDAIIYPLGGNLRNYNLRDFLSNSNVGSPVNSNLDYLSYNEYFGTAVGSNWEGSFSVGSSNRNGNLLSDPFNGSFVVEKDTPIENLYSVFNDFDRVRLTRKFFYERLFSDETIPAINLSGTYCFSFYIKSVGDNYLYFCDYMGKSTDGEVYVSEGLLEDDTLNGKSIKKFKIPTHYCRVSIVVSNPGSNPNPKYNGFKIRLLSSSINPGTFVDICGICLSEGKVPVEIDYRTDGKSRPLAFKPSLSSEGWTIKYTRCFPFGRYNDDNNAFNLFEDFVGGCKVKYPTSYKSYSGDYETVTVLYDGSSYKYYIRNINGSVTKITNPETYSSDRIIVGGDADISILLGGHMSEDTFIPTPGIYRDLMVFNRPLTDNESRCIDNTVMSISFKETENDKYGYIRGSLFKEIL
jgi:hypothetical protein